MFTLFLFLLISLAVGIALLWFYPGSMSESRRSVLSDIFTNINDLFRNIRKLFEIIKSSIEDSSDLSTDSNSDGDVVDKTNNSTDDKAEDSVNPKPSPVQASASDSAEPNQIEAVTQTQISQQSSDTPASEEVSPNHTTPQFNDDNPSDPLIQTKSVEVDGPTLDSSQTSEWGSPIDASVGSDQTDPTNKTTD